MRLFAQTIPENYSVSALGFFRFKVLFYVGNNSVPKFIFRLSRFPLYRGSVLDRFYCTLLLLSSCDVWKCEADGEKTTLNVEQSHSRPGQALRVPGGWCSQITRQSAHEGCKVVSPTHRPPLPSRKYSWYWFLLDAESTQGPGLCQWKFPVQPSGIEPVTCRFVA